MRALCILIRAVLHSQSDYSDSLSYLNLILMLTLDPQIVFFYLPFSMPCILPTCGQTVLLYWRGAPINSNFWEVVIKHGPLPYALDLNLLGSQCFCTVNFKSPSLWLLPCLAGWAEWRQCGLVGSDKMSADLRWMAIFSWVWTGLLCPGAQLAWDWMLAHRNSHKRDLLFTDGQPGTMEV